MIEIILIILWGLVGGFDWLFDSIENIFTIKQVLLTEYFIWEPDFSSYDNWVKSMLKKDPSYKEDIDFFLSRQEYINSKYPNLHEIEDEYILNFIQAELYGYEDEI